MGYRGKCYYFSETEGNWTDSQSQCSVPGASLAVIDSEQEMVRLLCCRFVIRGGGNCAYLNDEKGVSSSRCYMERRWICSKPEVSVMGKGTALEGGSK
ncbi:C-type lectin domain family 2 member D [Chelydra serpentina]|uniref:C-type lectin domain family 2 member D n=1 Tax=Chelydra serpentina TaxID=8475 RepID=A0A8T1S0G2_CHESE|nr:C-type lectin domain family 2 member D [Chelydra serpentina]